MVNKSTSKIINRLFLTFVFSLIFLFNSEKSYAQCDEYYINALISGPEESVFQQGSPIRFCPKRSVSINGFNLDVYQWNGYDPQYITVKKNGGIAGTLVLKIEEKELVINLTGSPGSQVYSIFTTKREFEDAMAEIENKKFEKDANLGGEIMDAIKNQQYFKAYKAYLNMNKKNDYYLNEINKNFLPLKKEMDSLYSLYCSNFSILKKEFYNNQVEFIKKNQFHINEMEISINGKETYEQRISNTIDFETKKNRQEYFEDYSYLYSFSEGKHLLSPVSIKANSIQLFQGSNIDKIKLQAKYDTSINGYYASIDFLKNDRRISLGIIVNNVKFKVKFYSKPFEGKLNNYVSDAINQDCKSLVNDLYPKVKIYIDTVIEVPIGSMNSAEVTVPYGNMDKVATSNQIANRFKILESDLKIHADQDLKTFSNNFYHPAILYFIKKLYPNSDSIALVIKSLYSEGNIEDYGIPLTYNKYNYRDRKYEKRLFGYIIPLQKGRIEIVKDELIIKNDKGNISKIDIKTPIKSSRMSIKDIIIDSLQLDSYFINDLCRKSSVSTILNCQYPLNFSQYKLGIYSAFGNCSGKVHWTDEERQYFYNDNFYIQLFPIYKTTDLYETEKPCGFDKDKPSTLLPEKELINFALNKDVSDEELKNYLFNYYTYLENKKKGDMKKANKYLLKADNILESIKTR
jgi:hypothetical protein